MGTIDLDARVTALEKNSGGGGGGVTPQQFNQLVERVNNNDIAISATNATIAQLNGVFTGEIQRLDGDIDTINDDVTELTTTVNTIDSKFNYSTTEDVVGTWIDGKPIYKVTKVYNRDTDWTLPPVTAYTTSYFSHNIENVEIVLKYDVMFKLIDDAYRSPVNLVLTTASQPAANALYVNTISSTSVAYAVSTQYGNALNSIIITFFYVKTTD